MFILFQTGPYDGCYVGKWLHLGWRWVWALPGACAWAGAAARGAPGQLLAAMSRRAGHVASSPLVPAKLLQKLIGDSGYDSSISWVLQMTLGIMGQVSLQGDKSASTSHVWSEGVAYVCYEASKGEEEGEASSGSQNPAADGRHAWVDCLWQAGGHSNLL